MAYIDELKSRYGELERREQLALLLMTGFLLLVLLYLGVWSPINEYRDSSQIDHDRHLKLLQYLQSTEQQARSVAKSGGSRKVSGQSLLTAVSRTAQSIGINPSRMQPEGSDAVSVWFDAVSFSQLMLWLERLESRQGLVVRQISIDRRDQPGLVSARIVLRS